MAGPTPNPFGKAFACAAVAFAVIFGALWMTLGAPRDPAYIAGYIAGQTILVGVIVGLWAWRSSKNWSLLRVIITYVVILLVCGLLAIVGSMSNNPSS